MLRVITQIVVQQNPTTANPNRKKKLTFNFVHSFEVNSSWEELTDTAVVTLPKNIYYRDANNNLQPLGDKNKNLGGLAQDPFFLKGDSVTISAGYKYYNKQGAEVVKMSPQQPTDTGAHPTLFPIFTGYISKVTSKKPFVLECEDNMWKLKQLKVPNKVWPASQYNLNSLLTECLKGQPYTVSVKTGITSNFNLGDFRTQNDSVADIIRRVRDDYGFKCYFRYNELRIGYPIYFDAEAKTEIFRFQQNIISDDLVYQRTDDAAMSVTAYSTSKSGMGNGTTIDGQPKTRIKRLEVLVTANKDGTYTTTPMGQNPPDNLDVGEMITMYYWNVADAKTLGGYAMEELKKHHYNGLRGKFTTFGLPFVKHGDNVTLQDMVLHDRNGTYKVKRVTYRGGVEGLRQDITLDYLIK